MTSNAKVAPEPDEPEEVVGLTPKTEAAETSLLQKVQDEQDKKEAKKKKLSCMDKLDICIDKVFYFSIMDVIEDDCRVRLTNVWAFLLVFIFLILGMLHITARTEPVLTSVSLAAAPPQSLVSQYEFTKKHTRRAKVLAVNDNGSPRIGISIKPVIHDFLPMFKLVPCGTFTRHKLKNTLEELRHEEVCRFIVGGGGTTGNLGLGLVEDLNVNGPAGTYRMGCEADGVHGHERYSVVVRTKVFAMKVLDPETGRHLMPPEKVNIGEPFAKQPSILVTDAEGMPVPDVEVIAFSNQDPVWPPNDLSYRTPDYHRQGQKLSQLGCSRSLRSDSRGYANFTCLKVLGSTSEILNIVFTVGSAKFLPWNDPMYSFENLFFPQLRFYRYPIYLVTPVRGVTVDVAPPDEIEEGEEFPTAVRVRVHGDNDQPVSGVTCYGLIVYERGNSNTLRFRRQLVGVQAKELLNPKSQPSDASGYATFPKLSFSTYGNTYAYQTIYVDRPQTSKHGLVFVCDGVESHVAMINQVNSKVTEVRIKRYISKTAYVSKLLGTPAVDGSDTFVAIIRVVDKDGKGVAGKDVRVSSEPGLTINDPHMAGVKQLDATKEATQESGFTVVAFQAVFGGNLLGTALTQTFRVKFDVDGVSVLSEYFTLNARGAIDRDQCNTLLFYQMHIYDGTSTWRPVNLDSERPTIPSGQIIVTGIYVLTESFGPTTTFSLSGRRLSAKNESDNNESDAEEPLKKVQRRLQEEMGNGTLHHAPRRKLIQTTDAYGTLALKMQQDYSNQGRIFKSLYAAPELIVPFEPPSLLDARFIALPGVGKTTLTELSNNGGAVIQGASLSGTNGTHFLRIEAGIQRTGSTTVDYCYSPPISIDIVNPFKFISAKTQRQEQDPSASNIFTFAEAQSIIIELTFYFTDGAPIPGKAGSGFNAVHLSDYVSVPGALLQEFTTVPMLWQKGAEAGYFSSLDNLVTVTTEHEPYKLIEENGEVKLATLSLQLKFKMEGCFGHFSIMFRTAGMYSEPVQFEVSEPPNLAVEVLREPSMKGQTVWNAQDPIPQQPVVRVTSNGHPVDGAILFAEFVPNETAVFARVTNWHLYDAFGFSYSWLSGINEDAIRLWNPGECLPSYVKGGTYCLQNWEGVAVWPNAMLVDGFGAGKIRFWMSARTNHSGLYPTDHFLNFRAAATFEIAQQPPPSMPLGMRLDELQTSNPFQVNIVYPYGYTYLAQAGVGIARFSVAQYNGNIVSPPKARALTQSMFKNFGCLFIGMREMMFNCGDITSIPGRSDAVTFRVTGLTWESLTEMPTSLGLMVSDMALSPLLADPAITMPTGMTTWPLEKQNEFCVTSAMKALTYVPTSITMVPETTPASAAMVIPPPSIVEIGAVFLARVRIATASGGAVQRSGVLTNIAPSAALAPNLAGGNLLQNVAEYGNSLRAVAMPNVKLDPTGIKATTDLEGVASFPLTILEAKAGNYVLKFQSDDPSASVLFTTPPFQVVNPVMSIGSVEDWNMVEVEYFDRRVEIPKQLKFEVQLAGNRTLEDLVANGYIVNIHLKLKGISPAVVEQMNKMKKVADDNAKAAADAAVDSTKNLKNVATTAAANAVTNHILNPANSIFRGMSKELELMCVNLAFGGLKATANETLTRYPELSEAVSQNYSILSASETLTHFIRTFTGAGQQMALSSSMRIELDVHIDMTDVKFLSSTLEANNVLRSTYEVTKPIDFQFVEQGEYAWVVAINGVASPDGAFKNFIAKPIQLSPPQVAWEWVLSVLVFILGVGVLVTNTKAHHWLWFAFAIPMTIGVMCVTPTMKSYKDALLGAWPVITEFALAFLLLSLFWGLAIELMGRHDRFKGFAAKSKAIPFGDRRLQIFDKYAKRRLMNFIGQKRDIEGRLVEPHPATLGFKPFCKQMIRPFNADTAFFFPSQLWVGMGLSMFAFMYILITCIRLIEDIDGSLMALVNKAIQAVISQINRIEETFLTVSMGNQLPDSATQFMLKQIELVRDWFENLVSTIKVGFILGVVLASLLTIFVQFLSFYQFRRWALQLRNGHCAWGKRAYGAVVYDSSFMGQYIATTVVGFALIVLLATLAVIPFHFKILWDMIWQLLPFIISAFIAPMVLNMIQVMILKKIIFAPFSIKHRAAASIFMFWQAAVSILGGIMVALMRFVYAILGLVLGLPTPALNITPAGLNEIYLADASHKSYIAAIMMYHCHNHPMVIFAARALSSFLADRQKYRELSGAPEEGLREIARKRAQRWVILMLMTHPWLCYYRKHAIRARNEKAAFEKSELNAEKDAKDGLQKKPAKDELAISDAMIQCHLRVDDLRRRSQILQQRWDEIRLIPKGPQRDNALKQLLDDDVLMSPGRAGFTPR